MLHVSWKVILSILMRDARVTFMITPVLVKKSLAFFKNRF